MTDFFFFSVKIHALFSNNTGVFIFADMSIKTVSKIQ